MATNGAPWTTAESSTSNGGQGGAGSDASIPPKGVSPIVLLHGAPGCGGRRSREQTRADKDVWPYSSRYFNHNLMNAQHALDLLVHDASFDHDETDIQFLDIDESSVKTSTVSTTGDHLKFATTPANVSKSGMRVFFVPIRRYWSSSGTFARYHLTKNAWVEILQGLEIPSAAIEVLHEDTGGYASHVSYCCDTGCGSSDHAKACAYHVWIKLQSYSSEHHFLYARFDLHTGQKVTIVAGTCLRPQHQLLATQFSGGSANVHLFSILLTLATFWARGVDRLREDLDIDIQDLEADTGHSSLKNYGIEPLPPEKLGIRKKLTSTRSFLEHPSRASQHLCEIFSFLSEEVLDFDKLQEQLGVLSRPSRLSHQLRAMFLQRKSQSEAHVRQTKYLIFRVEAQWNITNALVAQHNNTLNYSTARAARSDNGFIRRISFVTLTFLPATFLATFFSMTFFHTEQGHLTVSPQIWIYVVCAIPITFFMAWEFGLEMC